MLDQMEYIIWTHTFQNIYELSTQTIVQRKVSNITSEYMWTIMKQM